ncbi:hypothetical protein [Paenibacillus nasutitermitis]|uniref:Copper amine oxidase N-terminal domain-containing protein n=1 Tax=Paenibacillus nasutitermitis TaxID=1652958 RepID=A0A917DVY8_9BACL|nr:hypothetical protein [Paenibacillus nasutitermitis]GGD76419.1 hypothetical protein GCM10010911_38110 [Paenibacillus nasutitermitis]
MKKQKWLIMMTAAGLLATTAAVGANGLVEKVNGILHNDIKVTVNGTDTKLHPVYINGKAYLPARDTATALGYGLELSGKEIKLGEKEQENFMQTMGVIVSASSTDGKSQIEVLGHGTNTWVILNVDQKTVLTDKNGKAFAAKDLKPGMQLTAKYGPVMTMSYPGQSHAVSIQVGEQSLIKEEAVLSVNNTDGGWKIQFGEMKDNVEIPSLTLNAGKETMVVSPEGQPVEWSQIKPGTKIRAYYGPIMTKSLPPQSPAHVIVVLEEQLDSASVKEYQNLAWTLVPESQKEHLLTKQDEAQVELISAKEAGIMPADDKQKQILADIQAKDGKLISVNYSTDQDALLGPLVIVINPETKELVGFFIRK